MISPTPAPVTPPTDEAATVATHHPVDAEVRDMDVAAGPDDDADGVDRTDA